MPREEKSAGTVIFRKENSTIKYLLLFKKYKTAYYDLPKGNIEKGESPKQAALREAKEETGLTDLKFIPGFEEKIEWWYRFEGRLTKKTVTYYLAETKTEKVKISFEHLRPEWITLEKAEKLLRHKETKKLLRKAQEFVEKREKQSLKRFMP